MDRQELKRLVLTHYGGGKLACVKCGYSDIRALSIDHIKGDGAEHRRRGSRLQSSSGFYNWLYKMQYPDGFQTLCMNCQFVKRWENRECFWKPQKQKLVVWDRKVNIDGSKYKVKYYKFLLAIQNVPVDFDVDMVLQAFPSRKCLTQKDQKALRGYIRISLSRLVKDGVLTRISPGVFHKVIPTVNVFEFIRKRNELQRGLDDEPILPRRGRDHLPR